MANSASENDIEKLCAESYLADFVVRSPKYDKRGAGKKEAADLLLPFLDRLLCLQVKSRHVPKGTSRLDELELARIDRRVNQSVQQVKSIREALRSGQPREVTNLRGVRLPFEPARYRGIVGIAVLDIKHAEALTGLEKASVARRTAPVHGIPVHVFLREDFALLAREVDTLPDLFDYLDAREKLIENNTLLPLICEQELIGAYLTRYDEVQACLGGAARHLDIQPGTWADVQRQYANAFAERNQRKHESRLVDGIVAQAHRCIGFDPATEGTGASPTKPGPAVEYIAIAEELSRMKRVERMDLAPMILEKARKSNTAPHGYAYFAHLSPTRGSVFVFLASRLGREDRRTILENLCRAAFVHFGQKRLLGVAASNLSATSHSQDFLLIKEGAQVPDIAGARRAAVALFQPPKQRHMDEWGNNLLKDPVHGADRNMPCPCGSGRKWKKCCAH